MSSKRPRAEIRDALDKAVDARCKAERPHRWTESYYVPPWTSSGSWAVLFVCQRCGVSQRLAIKNYEPPLPDS